MATVKVWVDFKHRINQIRVGWNWNVVNKIIKILFLSGVGQLMTLFDRGEVYLVFMLREIDMIVLKSLIGEKKAFILQSHAPHCVC